MRKLKLLLTALIVSVGGVGSVSAYTDVSDKLVASGKNWPTFTASGPWRGENVTNAGVKGACTLSDYKFAEIYYNQTAGTEYTNSQTVTDLDNGLYKFRIAAFARKENIFGEDNQKTDGNNIRIEVKSNGTQNSTMIISNVMAYYELLIPVTDRTLTISIRALAGNLANWTGFTDASLVRVLDAGYTFPADATGMITNPSFSDSNHGWTCVTSVNGNNQYYSNTAWEYWSHTAGSGGFDYYQVITNVPAGRYKLSAKMFNDKVQKDGDTFSAAAGIYAVTGETTVTAPVTVQGSTFNTYTTEEFTVTNGTLRIGAKNLNDDGTMPARWFVVDDFELTFIEPIGPDDGTYYLYDATFKGFLARGCNYGTEASVDQYGVPFSWNRDNGSIEFVDWKNVYLNTGGSSVYTDNEVNTHWTLVPTTGGYYLKTADDAYYLTHGNGTYGEYVHTTTDVAAATVWTLKTVAERNEIVAAYPTDNKSNVIAAASLSTTADDFESYLSANRAAKDYTDRIGTAKVTNSKGEWTWTGVRGQGGQPAYNNAVEAWCATGSWTQTVESLPQGVYRVTVNAFERRANNATSYALGEQGYGSVTSSYMTANSDQVHIKSWYDEVEKNGDSYNPNSMSEAATAFNNDKYKNVLYTYVGEDGRLTLTIAKPNYIFDCWLLWNNVTLTYYDTNVSDEDATNIINEANEYLGKAMLKSLKDAISTAKDNFDSEKSVPNYNALREAIDASMTSVESYASMKTNYLDPLKEVLDATNFYQASLKTSIYDNYLKQYDEGSITNADANALRWNGGDRYVTPVNNLLMSGWTIGQTDATDNNSGFYINSWSTENAGSGDAADFANPFFEYWVNGGSLAANTMTGTLTGLTPNKAYDVTANVRIQDTDAKVAGSITMEVVGGSKVDVTDGYNIEGTTRYIKSYTATGVTDGDGNLVLKFNVAANSNISWLAFRDVNYAVSDAAISNDFSAINTAISNVEKKLGFENTDYAPYNNIEGMALLAEAKAFDQSRYYISSVISSAATALAGYSWTPNSGEVNAFYGGDFTQYQTVDGKDYPYGWNLYNSGTNLSRIMGGSEGTDNSGLSASTSHKALLLKYNGTYGETEGYTLPLKADRIYKVFFKYGGWVDGDVDTEVILTDPNGSNINLAPSFRPATQDAHTDASHWYEFTGYFASSVTGNYTFNLKKGSTVQKQIIIADIDLRTATAIEFDDAKAVPHYAPGTYPTVKISRSLAADRWYTAVYPFAVTDVDNIAVLDSYDKATGALGFSTTGATSVANEPFLMKSSTDKNDITLSNVAVAATVANPEAVKSEAKLKGAYTATDITNDEKNFVLSNNKIYSVGTAGATINPYRAYIQIDQDAESSRGLSFFVDDETTAIEGITADKQTDGTVYNLQGQRVEKATKGFYIVNGKKVVVK